MYSFLGTIIASFFLAIIRNSDVFSSYSAKIEAFFIVSPASTLSPAKAVDRFFAVLSVSAKSLS
jgi:hypothetical protein